MSNMSKQQTAKQEQGYETKPVFRMCSNCEHFRSDYVNNGYGFLEEKNIRCDLGGFAVKKQGTCTKHDFKVVINKQS